MSDIEIHFISLPTKDIEGNPTGSVNIPLAVYPGLRSNNSLRAEIAPEQLAWFSNEVLEAAFKDRYPGFAAMFKDQT